MSLQQVWETLKEAIVAYTPATFFTLLALLVATYYHVQSGPSDARHRPRSLEEMQPRPPPVQVGETTEVEELKQCYDSDPKKPLVVSRDSSARSSSPLTRSCPYDVFLSFRGADTRNNFTGHLYTYLVQKGINTFIDDEELRKGEDLSSSLVQAIQGSKISIVIFSENYASSSWCLDELVEILKCKELKQQLVWPVFYKVDPSDVRHQKGKYGEAFAKHECRFKDSMEKVQRWRTALKEAANLSGWTFVNEHEASFTSNIVEQISAQVAKRSYLNVAKYPVGLDSRVQDLLELLDVGGSDVRMVGIWGIGGIGKSTIARAMFNSIRHKFEGWCFLVKVGAASAPYQGLVGLQNDLLYQILGGQKMEMTDADRGIEVIKGRLSSKKVLLVLDDVTKLNQLLKLAGGLDWFGRGSRIIITTRDRDLLVSHQVNAIYTAKALTYVEARDLLIFTAFQETNNLEEIEKFPIATAVSCAHGLPLVISIIGSFLCGKGINQWHDTLDGYRRFPNGDIIKVLETSYDALEYPLKEAFLDIACFLNGKEKEYVMQALEGCPYLNPTNAILVLEGKALISVSDGRIWMHDLLEEMGKEIVRKESPNDAGRRSRIWFHEDVYRVLTENTGSNKVIGIRVELPREYEICLRSKCFKKMKNLQLFININARFSGEVNYLPNQLRFLDWPGFPAQCLPSDFNPQKLVKLNIPNSRISRLGEGFKHKSLRLKFLSLDSCESLTEVPDLTDRFPNLETLILDHCTGLVNLHASVGSLDKLVKLSLIRCYKLKTFPKIVNMKSLQDVTFVGCERLEKFPEIEGRMGSLTKMNLSGTPIKEVPVSIGYQLFNLSSLRLNQCEHLTNLPRSLYELRELSTLEISSCPKLVLPPFPKKMKYSEVLSTPTSDSNISHEDKGISYSERERDGDDDDDQGNLALPSLGFLMALECSSLNIDIVLTLCCASTLRALHLSDNNIIVRTPACLSKFTKLKSLILENCKRLQEVPELPPNLESLEVRGCESLERISKLSNILKHEEWQMLEWLDMTDCWRLCDNLVQEADGDHVDAVIFSLLISSQKSIFGIIFPGYEIPKWLSCPMEFTRTKRCKFDIQVLANFEWHNTALAICAAGPGLSIWRFKIRINGVVVWSDPYARWTPSIEGGPNYVWLLNIPFNQMNREWFGHRLPRPPFQCRVTFYHSIYHGEDPRSASLKSFGVHLVMPPNQVCMKLSDYHPDNELESSDAGYSCDDFESSDSES